MTLPQNVKLQLATSKINNAKVTERRLENIFLKELEIFEATGETTKNIKLLLNSLNIIPQTSIESERAEHD